MPGVLKGIKYEDPLVIYRGEKVSNIAWRLSKGHIKTDLELAIDTYYAMYLPFPVLIPQTSIPYGKEKNYKVIKELISSDVLKDIKRHTLINSMMSVLLSASFLQHLNEELTYGKGNEGDINREISEVDGGTLRKAVNNALKYVKEEGDVLKNVEKMLSEGNEAGTGTTLDLEESAEDVLRLAKSTDVKKLLEVVSWIPKISHKVKRKTTKSSKGELHGYELGSDVERLVPTELIYPKFYLNMKISEGKLLLYDKALPESRGPLYVLLDKSGSMEGDKIKWAKATAIALYMKSRKERREYFIRFFDGSPHQLVKISKRLRSNEVLSFIDYLARVKSGGGTDITKALVTACDDIRFGNSKGISDIILITDGEDRISEHLIRRKLKALGVKLVTVMIMGENRDLRNVSSKYLRATKLSQKELIQVVEA
ncbi:MAG: VWA domain-containing protein [Sulfolobales archaeon]|nr:VWA domain-containing protein [Sulfolobales archaeon]MCX8185914.1 VWA domain-containing protein [Sulfolobales archaeon]MDW7969171.1 VWA domain-containing protein [Sulfolobales archaeon]